MGIISLSKSFTELQYVIKDQSIVKKITLKSHISFTDGKRRKHDFSDGFRTNSDSISL